MGIGRKKDTQGTTLLQDVLRVRAIGTETEWWVPGRVEIDDVAPVVSVAYIRQGGGEVVPSARRSGVKRGRRGDAGRATRVRYPHLTDRPRARVPDAERAPTTRRCCDPDDERPGALRFPRPPTSDRRIVDLPRDGWGDLIQHLAPWADSRFQMPACGRDRCP